MMKVAAVFLLYCLAFLLIRQDAIYAGLSLAFLAVIGTGWWMRIMLRAPSTAASNDGLAELMGCSDPFQSVGLALADTAPFGEKRLVLKLGIRNGSLNAVLEGSQGPLPVPQVVLAALRDLSAQLQNHGKKLVDMRWTVSREEGRDWGVNVTFL